MILTKQDCIRKEAYVVQELLANLHRKWGPNICSALAHAPIYWENDVAARIAVAITKCIENPTKANVALKLMKSGVDHKWLHHPDFAGGWDSETAMSIAEWEAGTLLPRYRSKRLSEVLGRHYTEAFEHPERHAEIAARVVGEMKEWTL